jgi:hypothetical protein
MTCCRSPSCQRCPLCYRQSVDAPCLDHLATHYVRGDRPAKPLRHFAEFVAHPAFHVRMSTQTLW